MQEGSYVSHSLIHPAMLVMEETIWIKLQVVMLSE